MLVSIDLIRSSFLPFIRLQLSLRGFKFVTIKMGRRNREVSNTEEVYESRGPGKNDFSKWKIVIFC